MESEPPPSSGRLRFGEFEVDLGSHELRRNGARVPLQEKSFVVLREISARPGEVVTRENLVAALWPKEYFVDAEHGLNTAVRRLREALGDSADSPRFVETLPKIGYRFVAAVEVGGSAPTALSALPVTPDGSTAPFSRADGEPASQPGSRRGAAVAVAILLATGFVVWRAITPGKGATPRGSSEASATAVPDPVGDLLARSRYLRNTKRLDEAKALVEEALRLEPKNAEAIAGLALSYLGEGRDDEARERALRALEIDSGAWEAHRALGALARSAGDFVGAELHFRKATEGAPDDAKTRNRLARHLLECGRFDEARSEMEKTRRLAPDDPDVQNIWIELALRTGDYEEAIRQGELWRSVWGARLEGPAVSTVHEMLGLAYLGARRPAEANAAFRLVDPDDRLRPALVAAYGGRIEEASALLEAREIEGATAQTDPGRDGALAMAWTAAGRLDRAFARIDRQIDARWYPGWIHCALFAPLREDKRWSALEARLAREFFGGESRDPVPTRLTIRQVWPRPAPPSRAG